MSSRSDKETIISIYNQIFHNGLNIPYNQRQHFNSFSLISFIIVPCFIIIIVVTVTVIIIIIIIIVVMVILILTIILLSSTFFFKLLFSRISLISFTYYGLS